MGNGLYWKYSSLTVLYCFVCIYYITADLYLSCFCRNFFLRPAGIGCTPTTTAVSAARYCLFSAAHMGMYRQAANHALQAILGDERGICGRLFVCLLVPLAPASFLPALRTKSEILTSLPAAPASSLPPCY